MHENIGPVDVQVPQATYLSRLPDGSIAQETLLLDTTGPLEDQIQREVSMNPQLYDNTVFELPNGLLHMQDGQGVLMDGNMLDAMDNPSIMAMLGQPTSLPVQAVMPQEELPADFDSAPMVDMPVVPEMMAPEAPVAPVAPVAPTMGGESGVSSLYQAQRMGPDAEAEFLMRYGSMGPKTGMVSNFDPEGSGYDYASAEAFGMGPDADGHYYSRVPETGLLLKGAGHPTFDETLEGEAKAGNAIVQGSDGRYYTRNIVDPMQFGRVNPFLPPDAPFDGKEVDYERRPSLYIHSDVSPFAPRKRVPDISDGNR